MSSSILTLLDYIEKAIAELYVGIRKKSLKRTKIELEKLTAFLNCLKSQLPREFVETTFADFDRHLHFIGYYLKKKDFEWIKSNFDDIRQHDFPNIKPKIYRFIEKEKLPKKIIAPLSKDIFLVHGRDRKSVKELKSMLKEFGLNPIILHEQPSGSRTIVEKLEKYSDVDYAFVILTPDDVGGFADKMPKVEEAFLSIGAMKEFFDTAFLKSRARQNVVLEFGYFIGKLGRDRVCCLHKGDIELPSDMHGIVYIPFRESVNECRDKIVKELKAAGYDIEIPSKSEEFESRYWVDLGYWEDWEPKGKEAKKLYSELGNGILYLSSGITESGNLVSKTYDVEEAKRIVREARRIVDEYKGSLLESEMDLDMIKEMFSITKQPQCPKCGKLRRFSDFHCSDCGTELQPKEFIEV